MSLIAYFFPAPQVPAADWTLEQREAYMEAMESKGPKWFYRLTLLPAVLGLVALWILLFKSLPQSQGENREVLALIVFSLIAYPGLALVATVSAYPVTRFVTKPNGDTVAKIGYAFHWGNLWNAIKIASVIIGVSSSLYALFALVIHFIALDMGTPQTLSGHALLYGKLALGLLSFGGLVYSLLFVTQVISALGEGKPEHTGDSTHDQNAKWVLDNRPRSPIQVNRGQEASEFWEDDD